MLFLPSRNLIATPSLLVDFREKMWYNVRAKTHFTAEVR